VLILLVVSLVVVGGTLITLVKTARNARPSVERVAEAHRPAHQARQSFHFTVTEVEVGGSKVTWTQHGRFTATVDPNAVCRFSGLPATGCPCPKHQALR